MNYIIRTRGIFGFFAGRARNRHDGKSNSQIQDIFNGANNKRLKKF